MIQKKYGEDLFEETKMTFGEHLEELRVCLFRAVVGLFLAVGVGLYFGTDIVEFIQGPMRKALIKFYTKKENAENRFRQSVDPDNPDDVQLPANIDERVRAGWLPEHKMVDTESFAELLDQFGVAHTTPDTTAPSIVGLVTWTHVEGDPRVSLKSLSAQESFLIWLKAGFFGGLLLAAPWIFWQVWIFVASGLYPHEKRYVYIFLPFSVALFLAGAALAFFAVFRFVLDFLFGFNAAMGIDPDPRISEWLGFVLFLPLGFGVSFQLPLVMLFLERIGIFSIEAYWEKWRIAVLVIAVLSMLLTPADPMSMLLMFIPLTMLFFLGILLCKHMPRGDNPFGEPA